MLDCAVCGGPIPPRTKPGGVAQKYCGTACKNRRHVGDPAHAARRRRWREAHPETYKEQNARYRLARDFQRGAEWVPAERLTALLAEFDYGCAYCWEDGKYTRHAEWDHVIPLAKGGTHTADNLVPSCREHNRQKGAKYLSEFYGFRE